MRAALGSRGLHTSRYLCDIAMLSKGYRPLQNSVEAAWGMARSLEQSPC